MMLRLKWSNEDDEEGCFLVDFAVVSLACFLLWSSVEDVVYGEASANEPISATLLMLDDLLACER